MKLEIFLLTLSRSWIEPFLSTIEVNKTDSSQQYKQ